MRFFAMFHAPAIAQGADRSGCKPSQIKRCRVFLKGGHPEKWVLLQRIKAAWVISAQVA
jgi:hypothetical protein